MNKRIDKKTAENSNYALERLRELLSESTIEPNGKLPTERALSERWGVGRREVRRALEVVEAEGLIWRKQGAGTFLGQKPDNWGTHAANLIEGTDFMEIMEVRLRIEPQLAQLAALRAKPKDIERMRALRDKIYERTDADWRELWDGSLHRLIAQSAGNQLFLSLFDVVNRVRQDPAWQAIRERARRQNASLAESRIHHNQIIEAIAARDPERAGEAMRQHLLSLEERLIRQTSLGYFTPAALGEESD
ncbi:GntR family transcriptional regulator [Brenneria goodwinii]|uniref:GntR family transcriptional regulator n=1 Tax=Brenneria goodwinii TaxID=1109412 RepID=A0A0G4JY52_9GAMM|nr:FCD domain-containing protein [Brenneria goodwinii]ATA23310.1 GntR family transcriptional regulator [Brenneria goodwinii]MCG8157540.1 FadR family transcriptional regulator [Brenneria goodwinii]MCG8161975.1 FadR family transcriptional regulator [Brenneria goodwinii]MCG8166772.1 FadR family transcriptional regulator [Brenneria goodwinii]MCG8171231.1 FadR family transcriptional regulator [Brenneria goodwinii]